MDKSETKELLDLALHPVRMRILMLLSGSQGLTPQQMAERMDDVPQATLYRNINRLAQAELICVVKEQPVRGTVEKVYALNTGAGQPSPEESLAAFNRLSKEEHLRYFTAFMLSALGDFSRYLNQTEGGTRNLAADGVGYHKLALYLNDEEMARLGAALNEALLPFLELKEVPGRRKRLFSTIMMPDSDALEGSDHEVDR